MRVYVLVDMRELMWVVVFRRLPFLHRSQR